MLVLEPKPGSLIAQPTSKWDATLSLNTELNACDKHLKSVFELAVNCWQTPNFVALSLFTYAAKVPSSKQFIFVPEKKIIIFRSFKWNIKLKKINLHVILIVSSLNGRNVYNSEL